MRNSVKEIVQHWAKVSVTVLQFNGLGTDVWICHGVMLVIVKTVSVVCGDCARGC